MTPIVDFIIPTYGNDYWLRRCLASIAEAEMPEIGTVHVVDNHGSFHESNFFCPGLNIRVYKPGKNLGWTGGLQHALPFVTSEYVVFMNDDAEFERMPDRLALLLEHFADPDVAAVGPATGVAMGRQAHPGPDVEQTTLLVGFCILLRKKTLEELGGVQGVTVNGVDLGDDVDLCFRINRAKKKMLIDRRVFVYHHAFKTGTRLYGNARKDGGWNSMSMVSEVVQQLFLKYQGDEPVLLETMGDHGQPNAD